MARRESDIDSRGRCIRHPFVQLKRRSNRTGIWKTLLDRCPICRDEDDGIATGVEKSRRLERSKSLASSMPSDPHGASLSREQVVDRHPPAPRNPTKNGRTEREGRRPKRLSMSAPASFGEDYSLVEVSQLTEDPHIQPQPEPSTSLQSQPARPSSPLPPTLLPPTHPFRLSSSPPIKAGIMTADLTSRVGGAYSREYTISCEYGDASIVSQLTEDPLAQRQQQQEQEEQEQEQQSSPPPLHSPPPPPPTRGRSPPPIARRQKAPPRTAVAAPLTSDGNGGTMKKSVAVVPLETPRGKKNPHVINSRPPPGSSSGSPSGRREAGPHAPPLAGVDAGSQKTSAVAKQPKPRLDRALPALAPARPRRRRSSSLTLPAGSGFAATGATVFEGPRPRRRRSSSLTLPAGTGPAASLLVDSIEGRDQLMERSLEQAASPEDEKGEQRRQLRANLELLFPDMKYPQESQLHGNGEQLAQEKQRHPSMSRDLSRNPPDDSSPAKEQAKMNHANREKCGRDHGHGYNNSHRGGGDEGKQQQVLQQQAESVPQQMHAGLELEYPSMTFHQHDKGSYNSHDHDDLSWHQNDSLLSLLPPQQQYPNLDFLWPKGTPQAYEEKKDQEEDIATYKLKPRVELNRRQRNKGRRSKSRNQKDAKYRRSLDMIKSSAPVHPVDRELETSSTFFTGISSISSNSGNGNEDEKKSAPSWQPIMSEKIAGPNFKSGAGLNHSQRRKDRKNRSRRQNNINEGSQDLRRSKSERIKPSARVRPMDRELSASTPFLTSNSLSVNTGNDGEDEKRGGRRWQQFKVYDEKSISSLSDSELEPDGDSATVKMSRPNISVSACDSQGRCIRHPQNRLRKKKIFGGGWKVLMKACPDCCVEELLGMQSPSNPGGGANLLKVDARDDVKSKDEDITPGSGKKMIHVAGVMDIPEDPSNGNVVASDILQRKFLSSDRDLAAEIPGRGLTGRDAKGDKSAIFMQRPGRDTPGSKGPLTHGSGGSRRHIKDNIATEGILQAIPTRSEKNTGQDLDHNNRSSSTQRPRHDATHSDGLPTHGTSRHVRRGKSERGKSGNAAAVDKLQTVLDRGAEIVKDNEQRIPPTTMPDKEKSKAPPEFKVEGYRERVSQMEYTDVNGVHGKFSGTVDERRLPEGLGVMVYDSGVKVKGVWENGQWRRPRSERGGRNRVTPRSSTSGPSMRSKNGSDGSRRSGDLGEGQPEESGDGSAFQKEDGAEGDTIPPLPEPPMRRSSRRSGGQRRAGESKAAHSPTSIIVKSGKIISDANIGGKSQEGLAPSKPGVTDGKAAKQQNGSKMRGGRHPWESSKTKLRQRLASSA